MKCGKREFDQKLDALIAVWKATAKRRRGYHHRKERRAYYCRRCKAWHITSQEYNP